MSARSEWIESLEKAFPDRALSFRIHNAAAGAKTDLPRLFFDISKYVLSLKEQIGSKDGEPNAKKRKLEDDIQANNTHIVPKAMPSKHLTTFFDCKDVSVQVPARKKMKVDLAVDPKNERAGQIRLLNPTDQTVEYALPAEAVEEAFCLPMPEKQARQMNFVLFPKAGALDGFGRPAEQLLFVMNESLPKELTFHGATVAEDDTFVTITQRALEKLLRPYGKKVIAPNAAEFASSIPQSHRKGEKAYHVKAHRGSKEGYLFFLSNGIVFGFKKPLAFFPFSSIESTSYTSVLQRTFNLVIAAREDGPAEEVKEVEFSMLDQGDFAGIDAYVNKHGLKDASMAAQRRAKTYNVNKVKKGEEKDELNGGGGGMGEGEDEQTELQKAEQLLQDEEDELEEDYEVSGGESEGEGEDSEEEEGEGYDDEEVEEGEGEGEYEDEVDE